MAIPRHVFYIIILVFSANTAKSKSSSAFTVNDLGREIEVDRRNRSEDDSLSIIAKKELQVVECRLSHDTLTIISANNNCYYPFGKFKDINAFIKTRGFSYKVEKTEYKTNLYRLLYKNSLLKFIKDEDAGFFQLVSGKVVDTQLGLLNGIKIGASKNVFLNGILENADVSNRDINVVLIASAAIGIWHFYDFKDGKLVRISFDTDYLYNKK